MPIQNWRIPSASLLELPPGAVKDIHPQQVRSCDVTRESFTLNWWGVQNDWVITGSLKKRRQPADETAVLVRRIQIQQLHVHQGNLIWANDWFRSWDPERIPGHSVIRVIPYIYISYIIYIYSKQPEWTGHCWWGGYLSNLLRKFHWLKTFCI